MKRLFLLLAAAFLLAACNRYQYTIPDGVARPYLGGQNAPIAVQEFSDFQCPFCAQAAPEVKRLAEKYGDSVRWEYRHFPLSQIHAFAYDAALAAECANDQGVFWQYHDALFANQDNLKRDQLIEYAANLQIDAATFSACLKSRAHNATVRDDLKNGRDRGVNGTPTFFVNNQAVPLQAMETEIDQLLQPAVPSADQETETP